MSEDTLLDTMDANKFMRSRAEVVAFEEAMAELAKHPKNEDLRSLHLVLDDQCIISKPSIWALPYKRVPNY